MAAGAVLLTAGFAVLVGLILFCTKKIFTNHSNVEIKRRNTMTTEHKSGFVAIVGRPNVGKINIVKSNCRPKIAIMSDKAQTTRNKIQGIYTIPEAQIVFLSILQGFINLNTA